MTLRRVRDRNEIGGTKLWSYQALATRDKQEWDTAMAAGFSADAQHLPVPNYKPRKQGTQLDPRLAAQM